MGCGLSGRGAAAGGAGQLVDPHPRGRLERVESVAADRAGLVAYVCAVAQPDREAVAVAAAGRAEAAPPGGGLAEPARPGESIPEPVRHRFSRLAPLRGAVGRGEAGSGPSGPPVITDLESQDSLEETAASPPTCR